jgi:hypothetical protein
MCVSRNPKTPKSPASSDPRAQTARRPMRRRVCGGQIVTEGSEIRFQTSRTKPMDESVFVLAFQPRVLRQGLRLASDAVTTFDPAEVSVKMTESGDRHSLSDGCCSRGGRARGRSTGGAIKTGATRCSRPRTRPANRAAFRARPGGRNDRRDAGNSVFQSRLAPADEVCRPRIGIHANINRTTTLLRYHATWLL